VRQRADPGPGARSGLPDLASVTVVLCDADGNLFDSEVPAFEASVVVVNELLAALGSSSRHEADELRRTASGRNFRSLAIDLASALGKPLADDELARWVEKEKGAVTEHLAVTLLPDKAVTDSVEHLASRFRLAVVTSSALTRLGACLKVTCLSSLFPEAHRFSAFDSLPTPTSKPDPAVYRLALRELHVAPDQAVAIEDAEAGVLSAVAAGIPTLGNLAYVPAGERAARRDALQGAGAIMVAEDWEDLVAILSPGGAR
jgi:HAD superfamily hydrolase (TIGR01509 family)